MNAVAHIELDTDAQQLYQLKENISMCKNTKFCMHSYYNNRERNSWNIKFRNTLFNWQLNFNNYNFNFWFWNLYMSRCCRLFELSVILSNTLIVINCNLINSMSIVETNAHIESTTRMETIGTEIKEQEQKLIRLAAEKGKQKTYLDI